MTRGLLLAFRGVGLGLALILQIAWLIQPVPLPLKLLPVVLLVVSIARPVTGLLLVAGIAPMANAISLWAHSPLPGIRLLEQLMLALVTGVGLRWWRPGIGLRLGEPAALAAASAVASFVAVQPALLLQRMPDAGLRDHVSSLLVKGDYFLRSGMWDPLFFAALAVEGFALAVTAERIVRRHREAADGAIRMAVVGHAGVAALNLQQLVGAAIRAGDAIRELPRLVRDVRVSLFYDVNAAGSVFLLNLLAGLGLLKGAALDRWVIAPMLAIIALGLWVAGSRIALLALAATLLVMLVIAAWQRRGASRRTAVAAIAGVIVLGGLVTLLYPATRNMSVGPAATARRILAQTSMNMWRSAPVFGVGVGRFYEESSRFGGEALRKELGFITINENAHNYFLQLLSTEGVVGLAAWLLLLGTVLVPAIRNERQTPVPLRRWLLAGLLAYLSTWLTGHPNLVPEAVLAFGLIAGVLAGLTPAPAGTAWRTATIVAAAVLVTTSPFRAADAIRHADLEHVAVDLSAWQPEIDGIRYRLASRSFAMYLPVDGTAVDLPLRRAPDAADPLVVTIRHEGRTLYEPLVSGDAWQHIRVQLPKTNARFARVEVDIRPVAVDGRPVLLVGKAERRQTP